MNPVTDPSLLAELEGPKPVSDPAILKQLEGDGRWDVMGDIKGAASGAVGALKSDFANAFPEPARPPPRPFSEFVKAAPGEMVDRVGQSLSSMGSAMKLPLDALGVVASPITGAARAIGGSALSYLPGMDKAKGDEAVDQAMMGLKPGRAPKAAPKPAVPTVAELKTAGSAGFERARNMGLEIDPKATSALADDILTNLKTDGHRDYLSPATFKAVEELKTPAGGNSTIADIHGVQRILGKAAGNPAEKAAASSALAKLDDYLAGLAPKDIVAGDPAAIGVLKEAKGNWAAGKRSESVAKAADTAELNASASHSGANLDNATRQRMKSILANPKNLRGFTEAEIAQLERVVRGSPVGNSARVVGNLLGGGGGLGAVVSGGAGYAAMGPAGVLAPVVGAGAKRLGAYSTQREVAKLDELLRSRSPLAEQNAGGNLPIPRNPLHPVVGLGAAGAGAAGSAPPDPQLLMKLEELLRQYGSAK